jgi:hypothetical protein
MKKIYLIVFTLAASIKIFAQHTTITEWNFESLVNSQIPSPAPSIGTGTASIVGSMSTTGTGTVQGGTCANTSGDVAWNISNANPGTMNESSGVQFLVSTAGFTNIKFSFSHRTSNAATRTVRVQYTTDGGSSWTNFDLTSANYSQTCPNRGGLDNFRIDVHSTVGNAAGDTWKNVTVDFSSLSVANNESGFGVRLVAAHYSNTGQFRQAQNSASVATGGAWRFDNVKFEGVASLPTVSFNTASSSQTEGNAGFTDVNIPVTISTNPLSAVTVNVSVSGLSTATPGVDFSLLTPSLTFNPAPAPTTQNVTVRVFGDVTGELDETVILNLAIGSGPATLGSITAHTNTILNDDPNTFYSCASGLTNAAIWSLNDPTCATTTTAVFSSSNNFVIQSGHTIQLHASPLSMRSLEIENGGKLWRNSSVPGNMRYVNIYDYLNNEGTFGNDLPSFDAIGINAEGANVSIYGGGTWNFGRIRKNTIAPHSTTNLTISDGVFNLFFPGTAIYNDPTNTSLFIDITAGTTVNVYEGNVAIDGTTGLSGGESFGGITVNGTLNLDKNSVPNRGKFFGMCNNVTAGVCTLTINPGGLVVVDEFDFNNNVTGATTQFSLNLNGGQLHIREALNLFDGTFNGTDDVVFLSPDANTCAIIDNFTTPRIGNYSGTGTFQRGYNASNIYNQLYFSSPVNNLNITDFAPASGTDGVAVTPTSDCDETQLPISSNYGNVFEYNESLVNNCYLEAWVVRSSGTAQNGRGYSVVKPGSGQLQIEGTPNLAPAYTIPNLGNSAWSLPTKQNTAPNATVGGWHLLGNPYPSNLDPVNPDPSEFGNVFKVLDAANSIYVDRTFSSADLLPPFQGFFVYKINNGGTANFSIIGGSNRSRTPTTFFKNNDPLKQLKIKIAGNGKLDECFVNIIPGATASFDLEFDGYKWFSHPSLPAVFTSFNNELFSTNTIGSVEETPVVPLNFKVPATDVYQMEISGIENLPNIAKVVIEDKVLKKSYEFTQDGEFLFNATKNDDIDRFNIRFVAAAVSSVNDIHNPLKVFAANKVLNVDLGTHGTNGKVEVFNALGELVKEFQTNTSFSQFDISSIGSGTFIAKVSNDNGSLTKKFVIAD